MVVCSSCMLRPFQSPVVSLAATESPSSSSSSSSSSLFKNIRHKHKPGFHRPQSQPLVIETTLAETSKEDSSVPSRRLILLRHAKSSWEDRSLKGTDTNNNFALVILMQLRSFCNDKRAQVSIRGFKFPNLMSLLHIIRGNFAKSSLQNVLLDDTIIID